MGYLNEEETKTLLALPDTSTRKGRRDQMLLTLLYDSGARVQELADPLIPLRQHKRSPPLFCDVYRNCPLRKNSFILRPTYRVFLKDW